MRKRLQPIVMAAGIALGLGLAPAAAEEVNLYSARHYDTDVALYDDFTAQTGIDVNLIEGDADQLIERIKAEGRNSPADILITVDAGRLWRAEEAGILQPVRSAVLEERIPANLRHPDGLWFGFSKRLRGVVYAKERVDPSEITTYEDLADPKWEGRICMRSSTNVYNQSLVASMIEADGVAATETWAKGLVENFARPPQGADTDQITAVAAGECDIAVVNHYYFVRLLKSDDGAEIGEQVGIVFPNQDGRGAHANISGAGVVATAPHPENAVEFLEYLTTPSAQVYFAEGNNEFPVVAGIKLDPILEFLGRDQDRRRQRRQARREQPRGGQADGSGRLEMNGGSAMSHVHRLLAASALCVAGASAAAADDGKVDEAAVLTTYADIAHATYEDSLVAAQSFAAAVDALIAAPGATPTQPRPRRLARRARALHAERGVPLRQPARRRLGRAR